jgi:hypothetical protein
MRMMVTWFTALIFAVGNAALGSAALVAHYAFDEAAGAASAANSAGAHSFGTIIGGVTTGIAGKAGNAYQFDGIDSYVDMGNATSIFDALNATGQVTISQWFNWTASNVNNRGNSIFLGNDANNSQDLSLGTTGEPLNNVGGVWVRNRWASGGANLKEIVNTTSGLNDGAWHHVVATINLVPGDIALYVDGVLHSTINSPNQLFPTFNNFEIGRLGRLSPVAYYIGGIDDTQIYDTALTADQVAYLFAHPGQAVPSVVPGDFDSDQDVDGADFVAWQTNFPMAAGATLAMGDADADGDVDGADFVVWQTNFPTSPPSPSSIPEPASIMILLFGCSASLAGRFRRKRVV